MKVRINGRDAYFDWKHQVPKNPSKLSSSAVPKTPESTTCIMRGHDGQVIKEVSVVKHVNDAPNRNLARKLSLERMLWQVFPYTKENRAAVWQVFNKEIGKWK